MTKSAAIAAAFVFLAQSVMAGDLPNQTATPGAINPTVTQDNIHQTICIQGWTKTIRPPTSYTRSLKMMQIEPGENPADYEEDHLIPLSIGGAPRDPRNLWAQRWRGKWGAYTKDRLEIRLQRLVCSGSIPLADAQAAMAQNWIEAYQRWCPTPQDCPSWRDMHPDE